MFESWDYCWFKDRSRGNEFKCLSESNGKHIETVKGKRKKGRKKFHN